MKKALLLFATLLCVNIFSSCSKDDEVNLPTLTTQDFISICGLTESELDAKMSGFTKTSTDDAITYSDDRYGIYVSAYGSDENIISITMTDGISTNVSISNSQYPYSFYSDVKSDLRSIYPSADMSESTVGYITLISFTIGSKDIMLSLHSNDYYTKSFLRINVN